MTKKVTKPGGFCLHCTGADLFKNVTLTAGTRLHFLNVVERKRSAGRHCVNKNAVIFWYRLKMKHLRSQNIKFEIFLVYMSACKQVKM